jgi:hypothetical protein
MQKAKIQCKNQNFFRTETENVEFSDSCKNLKLTGSPCHTCESRYPVVWRVSGFPLEFTPHPDAGRE